MSRGEARTEPEQGQAASQGHGARLRNWRLASEDSGPSTSEDTDTAVKSRVSLWTGNIKICRGINTTHLAGVERLQVCGEGGGVEVGGHAQLQPLRHPDLLVQGGHHHVDVVAVEVVQVVHEPAQVPHQLRQRGVDLLRQVPGQLLAAQLRLGLEHQPRPREHAVLVDLDRVRVLGAEVHAVDVVRDEVAVHGEGVLGEHRLDGDVLRGVGARDDPGVARDPVESADVDIRLDGDGAGEAEVVLDGAVRARLDDLIEE